MVEVRNNGVPLIEQAPRASITQAIVTLADALSKEHRAEKDPAADPAIAKAASSGWLSFLGNKPKPKK